MRSGTHTLHWDSALMPTQRAHADPKVGDGAAFLKRVSRASVGRDGLRAVDCNFQVIRSRKSGKQIAVMAHWASMARNGYTKIIDAKTGRLRNMTRLEKSRPFSTWKWEDASRARRANGDRLLTYGQAAHLAVRLGVVIVAELKSTAFASLELMRRMVAAAKGAGHPAWFMALYGSMKACKQKALATVHAGGQFLVIFGRYRTKFARRTPVGERWWSTPGVHVERSSWAGA